MSVRTINLSTKALSQLEKADIATGYIVEINDVKNKDILSITRNSSRDYGIATLNVTLKNQSGKYSPGGTNAIKLGDKIVLKEKFGAGATDLFTTFTGYVRQRPIRHDSGDNTITLIAYDYVVKLKDTDIQQLFEAIKVRITNETLTPVYLSSPNDMFAQYFNFANAALATDPPVSMRIKNKSNSIEEPQWGTFDINYTTGQMKLGGVINARDNFDIVADYSYYPVGLYLEDIIEDIICKEDKYGNYLFNETSKDNIVANHLTSSYYNETGKTIDFLIPNTVPETVKIRTTLSQACAMGDTTLYLTTTSGFPTSGSATCNGDAFTWTGKTVVTLNGVSGIQAHASGSTVQYSEEYDTGRLWYMNFNNLTTDLVASNFSVPGATIDYVHKRYGLIILNIGITITQTVTCNIDYSFKTIQSTGIEINKINFKEREIANRFEAINELRKYCAPNYLLRTTGDDLIWATYINQKTRADYPLKAIESLEYSEDEDLYTRTLFFGKNANPTNLMSNPDVNFVDTGESYEATALGTELTYVEDKNDMRLYSTGISVGAILPYRQAGDTHIKVYIGGIPIDDNVHEIIESQVNIVEEEQNVTEYYKESQGWFKPDAIRQREYTYFYYTVYFSHRSIIPTEPIVIYDSTGTVLYTLGPNDSNINYGLGIWRVPGSERNDTLLQASTASYWINYSTDDIEIDYEKAQVLISRRLIPNVNYAVITADFDYKTVLIPIAGANRMLDGRWDTSTQIVFSVKPPTGYILGIIDLSAIYNIQIIDINGAFYKPDPDGRRSYDFSNFYTLQYSTDGSSYYNIAPETTNFSLKGGDAISFEQDVLGDSFRARYLKLIINDMEKIDYGKGIYCAAFTEIAVYQDVILRGEGKLIATTALDGALTSGSSTILVTSTSSFSGAGMAYIEPEILTPDEFWYSNKDATHFYGCTGANAHATGSRVAQSIETDSTLYDDDGLLTLLGDVVYKDTEISEYLDTQELVDKRAKDYAKEFYKNHTRCISRIMYGPHYLVGHTLQVTDRTNNINKRYFVEGITVSTEGTEIQLAYYP